MERGVYGPNFRKKKAASPKRKKGAKRANFFIFKEHISFMLLLC